MLLIALAISWFIHMLLIEINGAVYFIEISATLIIIVFSGFVLATQIKRLGERRENDRRIEHTNNEKRNIK
jgi:high-affinity Fe2+/Pb2+ permease